MNNNILEKIHPNKIYLNKNLHLSSTIFLFKSTEEVLLQLRDNNPKIISPNQWGPLGGHCNYGETPYQCAIREFYEESGYICNKINWYKNFIMQCKKNEKHVTCFFWTNYDNFQKINCYEGQKIIFLSINELTKYNISKKNISIINQIKKINLN